MNRKFLIICLIIIGIVLISGLWAMYSLHNRCSVEHPEFCDRSCNTDVDCYSNCTRDCGCMNIWEDCEGAIKCAAPLFPCKCVNNVCEIAEFGEKDIVQQGFCNDSVLEDCDTRRVNLIGTIKYSKTGFLCDIEDKSIKYGSGGCILISYGNDQINFQELDNKKVNIIGIIDSSNGELCVGQCAEKYYLTEIKVEKVEILEN